MPIHYVLQDNHLTADPNDYRAMVQPMGTAGDAEVIQRMIEQGSTVNRPDILAALEDYYSAVESLVMEGFNVNTPLANFKTSIKGVFDSQADNFDPGRHQLRARISAGARLRSVISERGSTQKQETFKPRPNPVEFSDINSAERNSVLTPGGMAQLIGHRLKFDPVEADQGIFFIAADATETKVTIVGGNKPAELMFLIPDTLVAGDYTLEVRATIHDASDVRLGSLDAVLTVS
jgi:hypothetical protein